jgi:histidine triad (HIT) family protein
MIIMECLFCNIINKKIFSFKVWEDENFFAFLDTAPINPGHVLLVPKNHVEDIFVLPDYLFNEIFKATRKLAEPLKQVTSAKRIGIAIEGFSISHAHIHLVPVYKGNDLNPERARKASEAELDKMQKILSNRFKDL